MTHHLPSEALHSHLIPNPSSRRRPGPSDFYRQQDTGSRPSPGRRDEGYGKSKKRPA
jgi:hypothetical protein